MTIASKPIIKAHLEISKPSNSRKGLPADAGFTLIELLMAVAIIAVLIALLLPVIQHRREEYAKAKAAENLTALLVASNEYFARTGHYPNSLADLRGICASPAGGNYTFNLLLTTGKAGGYCFDYNADGDVD